MQPSIAWAHSSATFAPPCDSLSVDPTLQHSPRATSSLGTAQGILHSSTSLMTSSKASTDCLSPPIRSSSFSPPLAHHRSIGSTASTILRNSPHLHVAQENDELETPTDQVQVEESSTVPKRRTRPVHACENCRKRKSRCILPRESDACLHCQSRDLSCLFRIDDVAPDFRAERFSHYGPAEKAHGPIVVPAPTVSATTVFAPKVEAKLEIKSEANEELMLENKSVDEGMDAVTEGCGSLSPTQDDPHAVNELNTQDRRLKSLPESRRLTSPIVRLSINLRSFANPGRLGTPRALPPSSHSTDTVSASKGPGGGRRVSATSVSLPKSKRNKSALLPHKHNNRSTLKPMLLRPVPKRTSSTMSTTSTSTCSSTTFVASSAPYGPSPLSTPLFTDEPLMWPWAQPAFPTASSSPDDEYDFMYLDPPNPSSPQLGYEPTLPREPNALGLEATPMGWSQSWPSSFLSSSNPYAGYNTKLAFSSPSAPMSPTAPYESSSFVSAPSAPSAPASAFLAPLAPPSALPASSSSLTH